MIIVEILIFSYLATYALYNLILSVGAKIARKKTFPRSHNYNNIAVLIPGYKEDAVIEHVVKDALQQSYPSEHYEIIVIADSFQDATLEKLAKLPIKVIKVQFERSTKAKALNAAFEALTDQYEIAVILDADNLMEKDYLHKINDAYNHGHHAIQAQRTAKNDTNSFAVLDGISEAINNFIFRKGFNAIKVSSTLIGSGMAFNYKLLKDSLLNIDAVGGFDRELQILVNKAGHKILYLEDALVYDEKVENPEVLKNQRRRWISSQFIYLRKYFFTGLKSLFQFDLNLFSMTIISNVFLPRILILALIPLLILFYALLNTYLHLTPWHYVTIYICIIFSIIIAIPAKFINKKLLRAIFRLPHTMLIMTKSMFTVKGANKKFIHTPHTAPGATQKNR